MIQGREMMTSEELARYAGMSAHEIERLLALPAAKIYEDPVYRDMVASLDREHLDRTAKYARDVYDKHILALQEQYNLNSSLMGGYTLSNWVLGFLMYPKRMIDMLQYHTSLPPNMIATLLPQLVQLLDEVPEGREEWQRALIIFSLPLLALN